MITLRILMPAGLALLAVALSFGAGWLQAFGPMGVLGVLLRMAAFFVAFAPVTALFFGCTRALMGMAAAVVFFFCYYLANEAMTQHALAERGITSQCLVQDEKRRVVTEYHPGSGDDPGYTTTRTEYVYRLRCPSNGPGSMVTGSSVADKGEVIAVSWDPSGRLSPRPATGGDDAARTTRHALAAGGLGLLLVLLDALIDVVRYPRRPDWIQMARFDEFAHRRRRRNRRVP
ncbi:hypothetical protein GCM10010191_85590 [Actinomadura vinacea]|uniref:DUF3592 domain-containing protein n=1 Tax=Actinomadura vinacea TaxID=115336 RepID=A0ABP5XJW5_9ACTN